MFDFINQLGMFGFPLLIIAVSIVVLTVKHGLALWGNSRNTSADINPIMYLGIFSVALGLFSHYLGMYQASGILARLRPEQIAAGYGQSLLALLYGFGIFFISAICWFVLRHKLRKLQLDTGADEQSKMAYEPAKG